MISVAMTTYNGSKYILRQMTSILNQSLLPDEVIIIDDCSKDNTFKIIEDFIELNSLSDKWSLTRLDKNVGFIESFFIAISKTKEDYVFLCDQDDIWLPNKIEIMVENFKSNSKILLLATKFEKINSIDKKIQTRKVPFSSNNNLIRKHLKINSITKIALSSLLTYNISPGCTTAFRRVLINEYLLYKSITKELAHDWLLSILAGLKDGLYFLNQTTTLYRQHDNNTYGLNRSYELKNRLFNVNKLLSERQEIKKILDLYLSLNEKSKLFHPAKIIKHIEFLITILKKRLIALNSRNLIKSILLLFSVKIIKSRYYESVFMDILILSKKNESIN